MTDVERLTRDYRAAFLRYLPARSEAARTRGYELGRRAVVDGVSLLDVTQVHHTVLAEVLVDTPPARTPAVTAAASEFLLEVLSTFDLAHRLQDRSPPASKARFRAGEAVPRSGAPPRGTPPGG